MASFNLGLIGGGGISAAHIAAARSTAGAIQIVAIADPAQAARDAVAQATGAKPYPSYESMFADPSLALDGVIICTPPSIRIPIVRAALQRGLPLMVEKPLAHNLADATQLADLAARHPKIPTFVGYCHRFAPAIRLIRERITAGQLGTLVRFENTFACWFPALRERWMSDPKASGGGSFLDTGCHSLDLFRYLIGPAQINATVFSRQWPGRGDSNSTTLLHSKDGKVAGIILSGWAEPARFTLTVVGSKALLHYNYEKPTQLLFRPSEGPDQPIDVETHDLRFKYQLLAFTQSAKGTPPSMPGGCDFAQALETADLVDKAQKSGSVI